MCFLWLLSGYNDRNNCGRAIMACKAKNVYYYLASMLKKKKRKKSDPWTKRDLVYNAFLITI